jgi:hypothetical protein
MAEGADVAVGEVAEFMAALATQLPEKTRVELVRLLGNSVASPSAQEVREARLGLLAEMFDDGEVPRLAAYAEMRQERTARGEEWPAASSLIAYYGTWTRAVEAAADLRYSISSRLARARNRAMWPARPYTREEVLEGIRRASEKVGRPITQWEYEELRRLEREVAVRHGLPEPRLAGLITVRRRLGSWSRALEVMR